MEDNKERPDTDKRDAPRYEILECCMVWRADGSVPERVGPAFITNASLGGVQLRTRVNVELAEEFLLQLGSDEGPMFIPGEIRYISESEPEKEIHTVGFRFAPRTRLGRDAVGKYMLALKDRVCAS